MVLVLFESALGYSLFKLTDSGLLQRPEHAKAIRESFEAKENGGSNLLKLQAISRFSSTAEGVEEISAIQDGKISKTLKKFLLEAVQDGDKKKKGTEQLIVSDPKLGSSRPGQLFFFSF